jgi:hypothetical protein
MGSVGGSGSDYWDVHFQFEPTRDSGLCFRLETGGTGKY